MVTSNWADHTGKYVAHIKEWRVSVARSGSVLDTLGLVTPLQEKPTAQEALAVQLVEFSYGSVRTTSELMESVEDEWSNGRLVAACLSLRLAFEFWTALSFAADASGHLALHTGAEAPDDLANRINRLVSGVRHPVRLPWGGYSNATAYSVQTFVDRLQRHWSDAQAAYDLLSSCSHPCFFQQVYLHMMGRSGDNWSNAVFAEHAHSLLQEITSVGNRTVEGIANDVARLLDGARPLIARHVEIR